MAGVGVAVVLAGVLGVGVVELFEDQSAKRVIFTQPGATATTTRDLENPSEAPTSGEVAFYLDLTNRATRCRRSGYGCRSTASRWSTG